jgi:ESS family glutamate:Na+ symporter
MEAFTLEMSVADLLIDFTVISVLLLAATVLRRYVGFFQRFLIPNSLIAGFLGLLLGAQVLAWIPFEAERMGVWVYHLLALTFICVGMYRTSDEHSFGAINLGFMQVAVMLLQAIIGLSIALLTVVTLVPELNPATGILLPLGFAMGPGIAYTIGQSWASFGFVGGGSVGLTIAAIGFLVAYFFGMIIVNRAIGADASRAAIPDYMRNGMRKEEDTIEGARLTFSGAAVEPLTVHLALVGAIYLLTWLVTIALAELLTMGGLEKELPVLWSFHFIIANLLAILIKKVFLRGKRGAWIDDGMIHRITGTFADYLIAASIMGISLVFAWRLVLPLLLICALGSWLTYVFVRWSCWKLFSTHRFERFIGMFAQMTGTIASGLALLRVTDPEYRSPVAQELVLSSGMAMGFGFPLLILINLPFSLFDGSLYGFSVLLALMAGYLILLLGAWALYWRRSTARWGLR